MDRKLLTQNSRIIYLTLLFADFLQIYKFSSVFGKDSWIFISTKLIYFLSLNYSALGQPGILQ